VFDRETKLFAAALTTSFCMAYNYCLIKHKQICSVSLWNNQWWFIPQRALLWR